MDLGEIFTLGRLINVFSALGDSAITFALAYLLRYSICDLTGSESETVVNRIIIFTMGTGLLTSLCAIMALIMVRILTLSLGVRYLEINFYLLIDVRFFKHVHLHGILLQHMQMYVTV